MQQWLTWSFKKSSAFLESLLHPLKPLDGVFSEFPFLDEFGGERLVSERIDDRKIDQEVTYWLKIGDAQDPEEIYRKWTIHSRLAVETVASRLSVRF